MSGTFKFGSGVGVGVGTGVGEGVGVGLGLGVGKSVTTTLSNQTSEFGIPPELACNPAFELGKVGALSGTIVTSVSFTKIFISEEDISIWKW